MFIEPGCPWQNPFVESFHSRVRDELLNGEQFACLAEAQVLIDDWREDYNHRRPHQGRAQRPPVPDDDAPARPVSPTQVRRHPVLGGLINEYRYAA